MEFKSASPGGKYRLEIEPWEARMSLWIESPRLVNGETGDRLFDLCGTNWSLDLEQWLDGERVKLLLRRYPGDHHPLAFEVEVSCTAKQALIDGDTFSLDAIEPRLEALYQQNQVKSQSKGSHNPSRITRLASIIARLFG